MNESWFRRAALAGIATAAATILAAAPASAHVTVSGPDAARGGSAVLTFRVPNESATGAATTQLSVRLPALTEAETEPVPGWKTKVTRDDNHRVVAVTWMADPGGGIGAGQFEQFSVLADGLPDSDTVTLPATQTYADGRVVNWDQPTSGNTEPEFPAPTLALAPAHEGGAQNHGDVHAAAAAEEHETDTTARWLGSIGIVLGALGVLAAATMFTRNRSRQ
ncbi:YcnI family copper-binding membrane protein [Nocardia cerradoensis]|uniref:YcnI family copper-binding membrane protein n=1 Tax=Nocardia cerradoensis TaxID=85688 RepID=UPI000314C552|nr:YcnI family protein [Nocardia cerradoensis]NKY44784.1 YcnI family protein [Nocardia cerradoensis]